MWVWLYSVIVSVGWLWHYATSDIATFGLKLLWVLTSIRSYSLICVLRSCEGKGALRGSPMATCFSRHWCTSLMYVGEVCDAPWSSTGVVQSSRKRFLKSRRYWSHGTSRSILRLAGFLFHSIGSLSYNERWNSKGSAASFCRVKQIDKRHCCSDRSQNASLRNVLVKFMILLYPCMPYGPISLESGCRRPQWQLTEAQRLWWWMKMATLCL